MRPSQNTVYYVVKNFSKKEKITLERTFKDTSILTNSPALNVKLLSAAGAYKS